MRKILLSTLLLLLVLLALLFYAGHIIKASYGYNLAATFTQLPADDESLTDWLKHQPGVIEHSVRIDRTDKTLHAQFIMSRNLLGTPPFPPLDAHSQALGYVGGPWQDQPR